MSAVRGCWFTNHVVNPVMRLVLTSDPGRGAGRRLALLRYDGRRTGRRRELIVQYARHGRDIVVFPAHAERKRWWRNMEEPHPVELIIAGRREWGLARSVDPVDAPGAVAAYQAAFPKVPVGTGPLVVVTPANGDRR